MALDIDDALYIRVTSNGFAIDDMTGDEIRAVALDASGDIAPDDSRRATYTDVMRAYWNRLQRWYADHPGAILDVSNELEVDTENTPGIIEEARGVSRPD